MLGTALQPPSAAITPVERLLDDAMLATHRAAIEHTFDEVAKLGETCHLCLVWIMPEATGGTTVLTRMRLLAGSVLEQAESSDSPTSPCRGATSVTADT